MSINGTTIYMGHRVLGSEVIITQLKSLCPFMCLSLFPL